MVDRIEYHPLPIIVDETSVQGVVIKEKGQQAAQ